MFVLNFACKMKKLDDILKNLPHTSWVYLMKNEKWKIIYVGKSVNLKSRVNSYFNGKSKLNFAKQNMVSQIWDIAFVETKNEVEALILETNLIKTNRPKYNVLMKDDKNLTYIKITNELIPEVIKTRIKTNSGDYFWPYSSTINAFSLLYNIKKLFKIRSCHIKFWENEKWLTILNKNWIQNVPCLDYYINVCTWPCLLHKDSKDIYLENIARIKNFLKWNTSWILSNLESQMAEKVKNLEFEEATKLRDTIKNIKELREKQIARDIIPWDNDIIVVLDKYKKVFIWLTQIRWGAVSGIISTRIDNELEEDIEMILLQYLQEKYVENEDNKWNVTIITPEIIKDKAILTYFKFHGIKVENPSIGNKIEIINFTKNNLLNFAYREELSQIQKRTFTKKTQQNILDILWLKSLGNKDIIFECYDISHLGGTNTVASRSVIINWKSDSSRYKKYKLKTIVEWEIDDFKSLKEILSRRTQEAIKLNNWPDLLIIDWWKWQLSSAIDWINEIIKDFNLDENFAFPNICSIAKREEEVFIPNISDPIIIPKESPELMLIQKIRDEAHRFAISFNRDKRNVAMKKNILEELPGFWAKTRQKLLKLAWSVDNLRNITEEEIATVLNKNQVETLKEHGII